MYAGIGLIERPVLTMRVLLFLQEEKGATLSDMISQGWNRRTVEASIKKMRSLKLVRSERSGSFPRFVKSYSLTGRGGFTAKYVKLLQKEAQWCLESRSDDLWEFPKGCMPLLALMCRKEVRHVSEILTELDISPTQLYKCFSFLEARGIVLRNESKRGRRVVSRYSLSSKGDTLATATDALDRALRNAANKATQ